MGRRKRATGNSRWLVLLVPLLVAASLWSQREITWLVLFLVVYLTGTITIWVLLYMGTTCDVITKTKGTPCGNPVRGRLRACRYHKREKRAAWFARVGITGPAARLGKRVARPTARQPAPTAPPGTDTLTVDKPVTDGLTIVCTLISTVMTIISTAVGVIGLVANLTG